MAENDEILGGRSIRFWAQFTEGQLLSDWGFNEKQIPLLNKLLEKADLKLPEKEKMVLQAEERKAAGIVLPGLDDVEEEGEEGEDKKTAKKPTAKKK